MSGQTTTAHPRHNNNQRALMVQRQAVLEARRDQKRERLEDLAARKMELESQMAAIETELETLDAEIDGVETEIAVIDRGALLMKEVQVQQQQQRATVVAVKSEVKTEKIEPPSSTTTTAAAATVSVDDSSAGSCAAAAAEAATAAAAAADHRAYHDETEFLTDPAGPLTMATQADEVLTEPATQSAAEATAAEGKLNNKISSSISAPTQFDYAFDDDDDEVEEVFGNSGRITSAAASSSGRSAAGTNLGTLQFTSTTTAAVQRQQQHNNNNSSKAKTGKIDDFFQRKHPPAASAAAASGPLQPVVPNQPMRQQRQAQQQQQHQFNSNNNNAMYNPNAQFSADQFPWSQRMMELLRHTFRIQNFRDHQKEIINATLQQHDVFVIMRTGGGKSLTYQLPALLEGRNSSTNNKVTFVISPLLSLIQDQEEQMNAYCPGSAVSFTSSINSSEQARRWQQVRDPARGVCLVLVTPERVSKSSRLCAEMDKLFRQGRLGRFVIDEAHCACQWGHDFRPDYAQLGKLKSHFPSIPVIAVTATASDRVRQDVCEILRLGTNYRFFRSTANRPNLTYSVVPKPSNKNAVIEHMAEFIKQKYPRGAGIVYTHSKNDTDAVADALCDYGVVAEAYHSDVPPARKELIHRSWMRNETQVVVATIAFGLGINKPDVRFVLHHSISKTLEGYYQESGRAGRDGKPAECILYYSPKDVIRMLKMVHGSSSEHLALPMIRYAQESGNDAVCKAIILTHLSEPNAPDILQVQNEHEGATTVPRDVGKHAQAAVRLLDEHLSEGDNMTMNMLVKEWRTTAESAPPYIRENPPGKDGLSVDACERIIVSLILNNVIAKKAVWGKYDTTIYLVLGAKGRAILGAPNPNFIVRLPKVEAKNSATNATKASKQSRARKAVADEGEWLSAKPKAKRRKKAAKGKATKKKTAAKAKKPAAKKKAAKAPAKKPAARAKAKPADAEVIEILSDDDNENDDESSVDAPLTFLKKTSPAKSHEEKLWDDDDESDEEFEF